MAYLHSSILFNRIKPIAYGAQRLLSMLSKKEELPCNAEIVIAGGGAVGSSVAYHLEKCGWKNILLLEQGQAGCGTSWHAAGLCGTIRGSLDQVDLSSYAIELFSQLEEETGVATGFKQCGSLLIATTKDTAIYIKRKAALARQRGRECHVIVPKEAGVLNPLLNTEDIEMALWVPDDGVVNPTDLIQAYLNGATKSGATTFIDGVKVNGFQSNGKHITGVATDFGIISCDKFINCAGLWARELGLKSNPAVKIPLHACEHFYIITNPSEKINPMLPVTRDYDRYTYCREWSGGLLAGGFEPNAQGTFFNGIPDKFQFQLLEENWDQFGVLMDGFLHRYPCFGNAEIRHFTNGPESFTPDGSPHVSKSTEFSNYYMAAGMNSNGIVNSAGIGRAMAELITYGESTTNIHMFDIRRISKSSNNKLFCHDKAAQSLSGMYNTSYPKKLSSNVHVMNSPIHCLLEKQGAMWGEFADWARPHYFKLSENETHVHSFGKPCWLPNVQSELKSCEESVGVFDLSSKSKINLTCADSASLIKFLENNCFYKDFKGMKPKDVVETIVHKANMSLVSSVVIFKVNENRVTLVTEPNQHTFLLSHLQDVNENTSDIVIEDITGKYASLGLVGPNAEEVLNVLLSPPFNTKDIRQGQCRPVDMGYATSIQLARHFMKGIDGWQIFAPTEYSQGLYSMMMKVGDKYGIRNAGNIALDSLRIRHMIPSYNSEIGPRTDETTLANFYQDEKRENSIALMQIEISIPISENWPWGGEAVLIDGHVAGNLTSVGYTGEDNKVLGLVFLDVNQAVVGTAVSVLVGEDHYDGKIVEH